MPHAFIRVAIPVLYVFDEDVAPTEPPGFDMTLLPVVSRVLKEHAGTEKVTVISGEPTLADDLSDAFTHLGLRYASLQRASPEAGNLLVAELVADNFDAAKVLEHLRRIVEERERQLVESVDAVTKKSTRIGERDAEGGEEKPPGDP